MMLDGHRQSSVQGPLPWFFNQPSSLAAESDAVALTLRRIWRRNIAAFVAAFLSRLIVVVDAVRLGPLLPGDIAQFDEGLISSRNCEGLWLHVKSSLVVMVGTDPLARELRTFVAATQRGLLDCFADRTPTRI